MSERIVERVDPNWEQMTTCDETNLIDDRLSETTESEEVTVEDLNGFDLESFIAKNKDEVIKTLTELQPNGNTSNTSNTSHSMDTNSEQQITSSDNWNDLDLNLSDYLTSEDEDFGNTVITDSITDPNSSKSYSSTSCSTSKSTPTPLVTSHELTYGQISEDSYLFNEMNPKLNLSEEFFATNLELQPKPFLRKIQSKSYDNKKKQILKKVRKGLKFSLSRGTTNVWIRCLNQITDDRPSLRGLIKMGPYSERKTGVNGSNTGPFIHRLTLFNGLVTITVNNHKFELKRDEMLKIKEKSHYFITNTEPKEALIYFKISKKE